MAVSKGQKTVEAVARTLYIGVGAVKVLAVNPNKKELEKLYDKTMDDEPKYVSEATVKVGEEEKKFPSVRISFVVTVPKKDNSAVELTTNHTFFLQKRYYTSKAGTYQVIDSYGRTAWATRAEIEAKSTELTKKDGTKYQASIDKNYRPAYVGEEKLTKFIKNLLNIPNVQAYVNGQWVPNPKADAKDCEVRLDHIDDYFKGNFKELTEIIGYQPDNLVKIVFGVRTDENNRQYQTTYTDECFKNNVTDFSKVEATLKEAKDNGYNRDTEYLVNDALCELQEYVVESNTPDLKTAAECTVQEGEADPWA